MPIETTLLTLPVTDLVILGGLAAFCWLFGWQARRFATRGRERALKRSLFEAKGAVPQLESAARFREQQAETLALELKNLKTRMTEQDAAARQQELLIAKRDREIRSLSSELAIVKDGVTSERVLLDDELESAEPTTADPELAKRYAALDARYEAMKRGMIARDDRIAELEEALKNPDGAVPMRTLEQELSDIGETADALKQTLAERETQLEALQTRLQEEVAQREVLEDLARRRSEGNRELKATAAKFEERIPELMKTIESRDVEMAERSSRLQAVSDDLTRERRARETREAEIENLNGQLADAASTQGELQQRLLEQVEAHRALEVELARTQDALRGSESLTRSHEATIADVERRLVEAGERIETGERTAASLRHSLEDRDFQIETLEEAARRQDAKLEMLRGTFFETKQAHKEHIGELNGRAADLREALARSRAALHRSQGASLLLIARLGAPTLLLPPPAAAQVTTNARQGLEPHAARADEATDSSADAVPDEAVETVADAAACAVAHEAVETTLAATAS